MSPMKAFIESIPPSGTIAMIIRHAERHPIEDMNNPFAAMLTNKGVDDAFHLGAAMAGRGPLRLFHSPVDRCRDTALNIHRGVARQGGAAHYAGPIMDLGAPYVKSDWPRIAALVRQVGHDHFLRRWFSGGLPEDLLMPLEEAATLQAGVLAAQLLQADTSTINVTHDWNIMLLREAFFDLRHEDIGMPIFSTECGPTLTEKAGPALS